jgi:hypothetical protein
MLRLFIVFSLQISQNLTEATIGTYYLSNNDQLILSGTNQAFLVTQAHFLPGKLTATVSTANSSPQSVFHLGADSRVLFRSLDENPVTLTYSDAELPCSISIWLIPFQCDDFTVHSRGQRSATVLIDNASLTNDVCYLFDFPIDPDVTFAFSGNSTTIKVGDMKSGTGLSWAVYDSNATFSVSRMSLLKLFADQDEFVQIDYETGSLFADWDDNPGEFMSCLANLNCTGPTPFDWHLIVDREMPWQFTWALVGSGVIAAVIGAFLIFWNSAPKISFQRGMRPLVSLKEIPFG